MRKDSHEFICYTFIANICIDHALVVCLIINRVSDAVGGMVCKGSAITHANG